MKRVLVTGGAGFIGSHLVDALLAEGAWSVTSIDNFDPYYDRSIKEANIAPQRQYEHFRFLEADICDDRLEDMLGPESFDIIIHIAAKAGVRPSIKDPLAYHRVNVQGTLAMLEIARKRKVPRFILASSSSVYGLDPNVPWQEKEQGLEPISPYAATKIAAEKFAQVYAHLHDMHVTSLRFFTVYGPRQRPDLAIHRFFRSISNNLPIKQFGDGSTRRDYTFITDIIAGVKGAMQRAGKNYEVYNLGNSDTIMLRDLIKHIEEAIGQKAIIEQYPEQPGDVPQTYADVSKAERELNYVPSTLIRAGLEQFLEWYVAHSVHSH